MRTYIAIFMSLFILSFAQVSWAEEGGDADKVETTEVKDGEESAGDEVKPIPTEKVNEIEGPKEAVEEKKEEKKEEKIAETDQEAVEDAIALWKAVESQNWPLAAGFLVMILVYIFNRFGLKDKIGAKAIPYVSVALGILAAVGVSLASGGSIAAALAAGVTAGLAAIGSWEAVFKGILGGSSEEAA